MENKVVLNPLFIAKKSGIEPPPMLPVTGASNGATIQNKAGFKAVKLSDEQLLALAKDKLSEALQAVDASERPEQARRLAAEVWDRLLGKPTQSINSNVTSTLAVLVANVRPDAGIIEQIRKDLIAGTITLEN